MTSNEDKQIFHIFDSYNIDRMVEYHNEIKRLFQNEICYINRKFDDKTVPESIKKKLLTRKNCYIEDYYPQLIITNFLMIFSYFEEYLFLIKSRSKSNADLLKRGGSIGRFKYVVKSIDKDIIVSNMWQFLKDAEKVRNCLLHANGRIDLMKTAKDIEQLEKIVKLSNGLLSINISRIKLLPSYISEFAINSKKFQQLIKNNMSEI